VLKVSSEDDMMAWIRQIIVDLGAQFHIGPWKIFCDAGVVKRHARFVLRTGVLDLIHNNCSSIPSRQATIRRFREFIHTSVNTILYYLSKPPFLCELASISA
jgi:hypothetical protein